MMNVNDELGEMCQEVIVINFNPVNAEFYLVKIHCLYIYGIRVNLDVFSWLNDTKIFIKKEQTNCFYRFLNDKSVQERSN
jgi:hypothetical protein